MKALIGVGGSLVVLVLTVGIQFSMMSSRVRNDEVNLALMSAFDYCMDRMSEQELNVTDAELADEYKKSFMNEFCSIISMHIVTDGTIDVYLIDEGWESGYVDVVVEETYDCGFFGKKATTRWERAFKIYK